MLKRRRSVGLPTDLQRRRELQLFQRYCGITFKDIGLLNMAFAHRSFAKERDQHNNERLEFLGDSVLGVVTVTYLYLYLSDRREGELARIKSYVVSEEGVFTIARKLNVQNYILIGKGEEYSGGRMKKALLADAMEAIIGAYFLDSGFNAVEKFLLPHIAEEVNKVLEDRHRKDYKTMLQELVQQKFKEHPNYRLIRRTGPHHQRCFWISVVVRGTEYGPSSGGTKKEAEQDAARIAYLALTPESPAVKRKR